MDKNVFWQAFILALFIFAIGLLIGYFIELNRTSKIISTYQESEIELLDIKLQENIFSFGNFDCNKAIEETMAFADKTYNEARILEEYKDASKLSKGIIFQHKKYDLLRTTLWLNTIQIKKICGSELNTIVYFYEFDPMDLEINARQNTFSRYLEELKNRYGSKVLLIPIAGNLDLNSIEILKNKYKITSLPAILINEQLVFYKDDLSKIEPLIK